ncbi:Protein CBG15997 [Caenorhabditis briggsae]|uniref:Protein CBG15997 n=1 Tax=Caenorhabditis briggsae TaxID=6238 RepID=A8XNB5_CAEBR|nr:Protein CBG15997 [Caenorhabditis briggsae]CAP34346.2 Protein CBG15997 [Caenorhabditis briggsae]
MLRIGYLISVSIGLAFCQMPYGPSQLDLYFRLLRNQNLGGFGNLINVENRIRTAERQQFLSGLPPLPMTHDEVINVLTTESPTTTEKPTARPTTPLPPVEDPFGANNIPEGPPVPEESIGGTYDEDGNFVSATNLITERKRNLHAQNRVIRQHTTPRPYTYPPLVFRAKPQPPTRDTYLNNLLLEIEEYDDFLDQVNQYKTRYPGAQVPNPYRSLPEGKLPALAQYRKK